MLKPKKVWGTVRWVPLWLPQMPEYSLLGSMLNCWPPLDCAEGLGASHCDIDFFAQSRALLRVRGFNNFHIPDLPRAMEEIRKISGNLGLVVILKFELEEIVNTKRGKQILLQMIPLSCPLCVCLSLSFFYVDGFFYLHMFKCVYSAHKTHAIRKILT